MHNIFKFIHLSHFKPSAFSVLSSHQNFYLFLFSSCSAPFGIHGSSFVQVICQFSVVYAPLHSFVLIQDSFLLLHVLHGIIKHQEVTLLKQISISKTLSSDRSKDPRPLQGYNWQLAFKVGLMTTVPIPDNYSIYWKGRAVRSTKEFYRDGCLFFPDRDFDAAILHYVYAVNMWLMVQRNLQN